MPDVKPFPKPDLSKYPEIPAGACLNFNNRYGYYQVYKSFQKEDLSTGKKRQSRITYGSIGRDGFFLHHQHGFSQRRMMNCWSGSEKRIPPQKSC